MFVEEAVWIRKTLGEHVAASHGRVLDVGASNREFRTVIQPHIHEQIHEPLRAAGHQLRFLDIKIDDGIDFAVDLTSPGLSDEIFNDPYDIVICCNILEHVRDRDQFVRNLLRFTRQGTLLMLTVPRLYPRHDDPIDTIYRPSVGEAADFVRQSRDVEVLAGEELVISDKKYYRRKAGRLLDNLLLRTLRLKARWYFPFLRWRETCLLVRVQ